VQAGGAVAASATMTGTRTRRREVVDRATGIAARGLERVPNALKEIHRRPPI
jgi:hypothetical protein